MYNCETIYSILNSANLNTEELLYTLFFLFMVTIIVIATFSIRKNIIHRILTTITFIFFFVASIETIVKSYMHIYNLKKLYMKKKYKVVIGKVSDYKEQKIKSGYTISRFKVNNIKFEFTNIENTGGYNDVKNARKFFEGSKIVEIRYLDRNTNNTKNIILYVKVCK